MQSSAFIAEVDIRNQETSMKASVIDHGMQKSLTECSRQTNVPGPKDIYVLLPRMDKHGTLYCKKDFADVMNLEMGK